MFSPSYYYLYLIRELNKFIFPLNCFTATYPDLITRCIKCLPLFSLIHSWYQMSNLAKYTVCKVSFAMPFICVFLLTKNLDAFLLERFGWECRSQIRALHVIVVFNNFSTCFFTILSHVLRYEKDSLHCPQGGECDFK